MENEKKLSQNIILTLLILLIFSLTLINAENIIDTYKTSDQCTWWDSVLNIFREYDCGEIPITYNNLSTLGLNEKELGLIINKSDNGLQVSWEHLSDDEDIKQTFKLTVMSNTSRTVEPYLILSDYSGEINDINITDLNVTYLEKNIAYEYKTKWCSDYTYKDCQFEKTETYYVNGGFAQSEVITYRNVAMPVSESMYNKKYGFYDSGNIKEVLVIDINDLVLEAGKEKSFIISVDNLKPKFESNRKIFTGTFSIMINGLEYWDKTHSSYWLYQEDIYPTAYTNQTQIAGNTSVLEVNNSAVPYDSLVGYWSFDSDDNVTAYDWSGNENHGTYNGDAYSDSGLYGDASNYDGNTDYISVPMTSSLNLSKTNQFTYTGWVNSNGATGNYQTIFHSIDGTGDNFPGGRMLFGDNGALLIQIAINGSNTNKASSAGFIEMGNWVHVSYSFNGTTFVLYKNGVQTNSYENPGYLSSSKGVALWFGQSKPNYNLNGSLDEVMIFNTSLNSTQIQAIYNNQSSRFKETGTTTFKQQNITSGYNRINLTASLDNELGSSVDARVGYWDVDKGYYESGEIDLTDGLVGHWAGDSNANDSSGNENHGTFYGDAHADTVGILNNSFEFDGAGDYVLTDRNTILEPNNTITVAVWVNPQPVQKTSYSKIVHYQHNYASDYGAYGIGHFSGLVGGKFKYSFHLGTTTAGSKEATSGYVVPTNEWTFVVGTYNGTDMILYLNGVEETREVFTSALYYRATPNRGLGIGDKPETGQPFNGSIDDVMIWNRSLSADEVEQIYVKGLAKFNYTNYQELTSYEPTTFTIDNTTTNILPDFKLNAGTNNFYTPVIYGDVNLETWSFTGEIDTIYPQFSNYQDNNYTLTDSGTGQFNVTIINTNGTAYLNIDGSSILATNLTYGGDIYNATYDFTSAGIYVYNWTSYGNGTSNLFNRSVDRDYYVNTSVGCEENLVNTTKTDWYSITGCRINDTILQERNWTQYDSNDCGTYENQTFYEYQEIGCNYCSYNLENTTKTDWENIGSCLINDTQVQNRSWIEYDTNYSTCYLVTGLESDLYENETYWETQETSCNYCSYNVVNSSWSDWENYQCSSNEMQQIRNLTEYDDNYSTCYSITGLESDLFNSGNNNTYYDYQLIGNNWTNTSWSDWNEGVCQINDLNQSRNLTEYDTYGCGLNTTYYEYNLTEAILVNTTKTDWDEGVCQINDLNQSRNWTQYDSLNLGCYTNETFIEYNLTEANIVYTDWSEWENLSCSSNQMNQSRSRVQYDSNNLGCFVNVTEYDYQLVNNFLNTSWSDFYNASSCLINDTILQEQNLTQYDEYGCASNSTYYNYTEISCDYCSYNIVNSSWSSWQDLDCFNTTHRNQSRYLIEYDENYSSCYLITGLESDLWNSGNNNTYYEYQLIEDGTCYSCSENIINTTKTDWENIGSCFINDTQVQNRSWIEYDENNCGNFTNITYWETQEIACDYCTPNRVNTSWSEWENLTCSGDYLNQSRNLTEYDENFCYLETGLESDLSPNQTYYEYNLLEPNYINTSWSDWYYTDFCQITNLIPQERNLTSYDTQGCASNITYFETQNIECNYCSYSVVNSSWSDWENLSCISPTHRNQSRYLIEYDENYSSCYLVTGLESDLFNSGNNNTYYEYQSVEDSSCKLTPSLSITSSAGLSLTAGESTIVTGNGCPEELTCNLYFNGTNVTNPYTTPALSVGTYELLFNTTGNINYTSSSVTRNLVVSSAGGGSSLCRYRKLGYYNTKLPWISETNCI